MFGLRIFLQKKLKKYKRAVKTRKQRDWDKVHEIRDKLTREITQAKKNYDELLAGKINEAETRDEKLWYKLTKEFYSKKNNTKQQSPPLIVDGKATKSDKEKADIFNKQFSKASEIEEPEDSPEPEASEVELTDVNFTAQEVEKILNQLNPSKAVGPDTISPRVLKNTAKVTAPIMARLYNFSMKTGSFPSLWKTANITPIYKKGENTIPSNFRPVSLLSIVGKVMERIIYNCTFDFLMVHGKLTPLQAAYQPKNSTVCQLLELYHRITQALDEGDEIQFIFCDVSKAFDRVWHKGVLQKMKMNGISGKLWRWYKDYLNNRRQKVVVNGQTSEETPIKAGVPQGSILGPLMFIIYMNDIVEQVIDAEIRIYADDVTLFVTNKDKRETEAIIEENLARINRWAKEWLVIFNPEKTKGVKFSRKREAEVLDIKMENVRIEQVDSHKHLGVILQQSGRWREQIESMAGRARKRIDILRSLSKRLLRRSLEKLFLIYIRPLLEYGSIVWNNCTKEEEEILEKIQREAARLVCGAKRGTSHEELYREVAWEKLKERREKQCQIMLYKIIHNQTPQALKLYLPRTTKDRTHYGLRETEKFTLMKTTSKLAYDSFYPSTIRAWNNLEAEVTTTTSVEEFKEKLNESNPRPRQWLYEGERREQILHCRLRVGNADLNENLFNKNLTPSSRCQCGDPSESTPHYLLICPLYDDQRLEMLLSIDPEMNISTYVLLNGSDELSIEENKALMRIVQKYIKDTKRFD